MAPMTPAIMPSWYRRAVSLTGSDRLSTVGVARAVMIGSFPGPIDPLNERPRFYSSIPARLARGWRPRRGAGGAADVVHLAAEEDAGVVVREGGAARGAGALELVHGSSRPPRRRASPAWRGNEQVSLGGRLRPARPSPVQHPRQ